MNVAKPQITFDTNMAGVWYTRAFWGTVCEDIGQRLVLTPTATQETLRRISAETEREWQKRLKEVNTEGDYRWSKVEIRRLATTAASASCACFAEELTKQGAIYATTPKLSSKTEELEAEIEDKIDETAFDLTEQNGFRDKKIVVEALARGFDIIATNNINSIEHATLEAWIKNKKQHGLNLDTRILRPEAAEERLREAYGKEPDWIVDIAARACITDPYDRDRSAKEMAKLIDKFDERGMDGIKNRIVMQTKNNARFNRALAAVQRHGTNFA